LGVSRKGIEVPGCEHQKHRMEGVCTAKAYYGWVVNGKGIEVSGCEQQKHTIDGWCTAEAYKCWVVKEKKGRQDDWMAMIHLFSTLTSVRFV
jgi:hypothetical protein